MICQDKIEIEKGKSYHTIVDEKRVNHSQNINIKTMDNEGKTLVEHNIKF